MRVPMQATDARADMFTPKRGVGGVSTRQPYNGMPAHQLPEVTWYKSRRSNPSGNCVELARLPDQQVAVRNSRHPEGPVLIYHPAEIAALLGGVRDGDFDHLIG
jgi:hypothetical protein